jgi:hypothetical protein
MVVKGIRSGLIPKSVVPVVAGPFAWLDVKRRGAQSRLPKYFAEIAGAPEWSRENATNLGRNKSPRSRCAAY